MMHPDVPPDEGREECAWCLEPWAQKGEGGAESPDLDLLTTWQDIYITVYFK